MFTRASDVSLSGQNSKFVLRFVNTQDDSILPPERTIYPSTVITGEGSQVAGFPSKRNEDYIDNSNHLMLIAPSSGASFSLSQTIANFAFDGSSYDFASYYTVVDKTDQSSFKEDDGVYVTI